MSGENHCILHLFTTHMHNTHTHTHTDVVKFDNSYSWARPKEVFYSVKVEPPVTMVTSTTEPTIPSVDTCSMLTPDARPYLRPVVTPDTSPVVTPDLRPMVSPVMHSGDNEFSCDDEFFDCSDQVNVCVNSTV